MDNEKIYTEGIHREKSRSKNGRMENFWYHYKWPVIGIAVFLLIAVICIAQSCSKETEDVLVMYAGPTGLTPTQAAQVAEVMTGVMPYDLDGNGEKKVSLSAYCIYSREQIEELAAQTSAVAVDMSYNSSQMQLYQNHVNNGMSAIYLLDPSLYEALRDEQNQPLQRLSDVLCEMPQGALEDGFGVRLGDTMLYETYEVLHALPADTVICLSRPYVIGKNRKEEIYLREKEMFASLVGVSLKESE